MAIAGSGWRTAEKKKNCTRRQAPTNTGEICTVDSQEERICSAHQEIFDDEEEDLKQRS